MMLTLSAYTRKNPPASGVDRTLGTGDQASRTDPMQPLLVISLMLGAFFALLALGFLLAERTPGRQLLVFAVFFCAGPPLAAVGTARLVRATTLGDVNGRARRFASWLWLTPTTLMVAVILAWSVQGLDLTLYPGDTAPLSTERFVSGFIAGIAITLVVFAWNKVVLPKIQKVPWAHFSLRAVAVALAAGTAVALFDVNVFPDSLSYVPYVGPATLVAQGGVPLEDVFSQYGLNYLLFTLALRVLPYSLSSLSAVVSVINVFYYLAFVAVAVKLSRHKALIALVSVAALLFLCSAYAYNVTRTPSVLGMRFLPPFIVIATLAYLKPEARFNVLSVSALIGASLWSIEALCFSGAVYGAYLLLAAWSRGESWRATRRQLSLLAGCLLAPHFLLSAAYILARHSLPDYRTYLDLVLNAGTDPSTGWTIVADPAVHTWALLGWGYGLGLAYCLYRAWHTAPRNHRDVRDLSVVASVCVLGIAELSYYVARSSTPLLPFLAWPLALLGLVGLDRSIGSRSDRGSRAYLIGPVLACIALPLMMGVFADRFLRPPDAIFSNSTLLRAEIEGPWPPHAPLVHTLELMRDTTPFPPPETDPLNAPGTRRITYSYPYIQAALAFQLSQKWQSADPKPLLVMPESATVLFYEHKASRLGLGHPAVDGLSPTLFNRALGRLNTVASGDVVIVGNPSAWSQDVPLDRAVLDRLSARCAFSEIDSAADYPELSPDARELVSVKAYHLNCQS